MKLILFVALICIEALQAQSYEQHLAESQSALSAKQYKEAQAAADRAIKLDPNRWEGYVFAANAYSSQRLYDDAIGMLQLALPRAPEDKKMLIREALADARKQVSQPPPVSLTSTASQGPTQAEIVLWKTIENGSNASDFQAYLSQFPNGTFVVLANARLKALSSLDHAKSLFDQKQYAEAIPLIRQAAEAGIVEGMFLMGFAYQQGYGLMQDANTAVQWYRKAAALGNTTAMNNLAFLYSRGAGVPQDYAAALSWYRMAANAGSAMAMVGVGYSYEQGLGVKADRNEAASWYRKAEATGDSGAIVAMRRLGIQK